MISAFSHVVINLIIVINATVGHVCNVKEGIIWTPCWKFA